MKKFLAILLVLVCFTATVGTVFAKDPPRRNATEVDDVTKPYTSDEWIVSPDEESVGDETAPNAKETDIQSVIACYDEDYIRIDILLTNSISFDWKTLYAIKIEYDEMNEYYTYYTDSDKLVYEKEKGGKIVKTKTLVKGDSNDVAGVVSSGESENDDVYFIINKKDHIGGVKGKRYYLTCSFFAGYLTKSDKIEIADKTIPVDMEFEY
jgi:hypothetical protein